MSGPSYESWGRGRRKLALLHGFTGDRTSWEHLRGQLSAAAHVCAVDLPGHGGSGAWAPEGWFATLDALEVTLGAFAGDQSLDLVGYSMGARLALGLALRRPVWLGRLVLESCSPGLAGGAERAQRRRDDETLADQLEREGLAAFLARWEEHPVLQGLRSLDADSARGLRRRRFRHSAEGLAAALRALGPGAQPDYGPRLASLRVPVLLLTGERDGKFTEIARRMAASLSRCQHVVLPSGHSPHLEAPEAWLAAVGEFLGAGTAPPVGTDREVDE